MRTIKRFFSAPKRFVKRVQHLALIEKRHDQLISSLNYRMTTLDNLIRSVTDIHADIRFEGKSSIIVIGRYKGGDYIQSYRVNGDLSEIVDHLRYLKQRGHVETIDAVPSIKDFFKHELEW